MVQKGLSTYLSFDVVWEVIAQSRVVKDRCTTTRAKSAVIVRRRPPLDGRVAPVRLVSRSRMRSTAKRFENSDETNVNLFLRCLLHHGAKRFIRMATIVRVWHTRLMPRGRPKNLLDR